MSSSSARTASDSTSSARDVGAGRRGPTGSALRRARTRDGYKISQACKCSGARASRRSAAQRSAAQRRPAKPRREHLLLLLQGAVSAPPCFPAPPNFAVCSTYGRASPGAREGGVRVERIPSCSGARARTRAGAAQTRKAAVHLLLLPDRQ